MKSKVKEIDPPASNDILNIDDDEIDQLFREAFDSIDKCRRMTEKMRAGASVSTPAPAAENNARGLVPQGEGSC